MTESADQDAVSPTKTGVAALDDLFAPRNRSDAPGLVIGVAQHGKPVYRRGFGLASVELAVANTPWTRMRIGSTSKHFTCLAIMLLAEDGLLDIDTAVGHYLPELSPEQGRPTLRQLMSHTGGSRCYLDIGFLGDNLAIKPAGQALAALMRQRDVNFAPGDKFIYNNGGYHLLSVVIDRVGGMPFERFLQERIFSPLGMHDTASVPNDFEIVRGMATLHIGLPEGGYKRGIFPTMEVRGEGAMISSVDDMLRWMAHLRGPKLVGSEESWAQILAPTRLNNGSAVPYGLGLMRYPYRGVEVIQHAGGVIGGTCQMLTVPEHGLDIIIMANINGELFNSAVLANQVVDAMLGDALVTPQEAKVPAGAYPAMLGRRYASPSSGFVVGFGDAGGDLGLAILNLPPMPLNSSGDRLHTNFTDIAAGPYALSREGWAADGPPSATLEFSEAGFTETLRLLPEAGPALAAAGAPLAGRYRAPDLDADATVYFEGESLRLRVAGRFGGTLATLEAFSDDVFGWHMEAPELPLRGVLTLERKDGDIVGFRIDTMRTRHMLFERLGS